MITITSIRVEPNSYNYGPEMHFEGVLKLDQTLELDLTDDEYALVIGKEFIKHLVFVSTITDGDS